MPQWYVKPMAKQIISDMKRHFKNYQPDTSPKAAAPLPGVEQRHKENTSIPAMSGSPSSGRDISRSFGGAASGTQKKRCLCKIRFIVKEFEENEVVFDRCGY